MMRMNSSSFTSPSPSLSASSIISCTPRIAAVDGMVSFFMHLVSTEPVHGDAATAQAYTCSPACSVLHD